MRFHILQHVDFEGPAAIADWLDEKNYDYSVTKFFNGDVLPAQEYFDVLIVMGGPMGVGDVMKFPWLVDERQFIQHSISSKKYILGICLGAQLIARACGAAVVRNKHKEIGWFDINIKQQHLSPLLNGVFTSQYMEVFHWHGDTFEVPEGALHFASSEACENQAFIFHNRIIALQFHIEITENSTALLVDNCKDELDETSHVQSESEIFADSARFQQTNEALYRLLDNIERAQR